jgi:hypothetical protein
VRAYARFCLHVERNSLSIYRRQMFRAKMTDMHGTHFAPVMRFSRQLNGSDVYVTSSHTPVAVAVHLTLSGSGALEPTADRRHHNCLRCVNFLTCSISSVDGRGDIDHHRLFRPALRVCSCHVTASDMHKHAMFPCSVIYLRCVQEQFASAVTLTLAVVFFGPSKECLPPIIHNHSNVSLYIVEK